MKKIKTIILFILVTVNISLFGQSNYEQLKTLLKSKDTLALHKLLIKWEASNPNDPELYVGYFNYFFIKSATEVVSIDKYPKSDKAFIMKSTTSNDSAYINDNIQFENKYIKYGYNYINKGMKKFPDRLDMRFGKIYVLGKNEDYEYFTKEIIKTIDYSNKINNKWRWSENQYKEDEKDFILSSIHSYNKQLWDANNDSLLKYMINIANAVLKYYPEHIESLNDLSIAYMVLKDYDKAIEALIKAEKVNPKDCIVLNNIAECYKRKGDKANAIKYYKKVIKSDDKNHVEKAKKQIEDLENKK